MLGPLRTRERRGIEVMIDILARIALAVNLSTRIRHEKSIGSSTLVTNVMPNHHYWLINNLIYTLVFERRD